MTSVPGTLDDSRLIKLTLAGHVEAFAALMDRHKAAVRRRIFAMVRSTDDTDDLLQEVQIAGLAPSIGIPVGVYVPDVDHPRSHQ